MKIVLRGFGVLVAGLVALYLVQGIAAESGEVVVLTTQKSGGEAQETRLWVVDYQGSQWLRSGAEAQTWYRNLREHPEVALSRGSKSQPYRAVPSVDDREKINDLMAEKYGWADSYIGYLFSRVNSIPIRLVPRSG